MNVIALGLRLLGGAKLWAAMKRGAVAGDAPAVVVKMRSGVFDLFVGFRKREPKDDGMFD